MSAILIVDDDPTIRAMFSRALRDLGEIETASNGGDALRALAARKYAVVLLDLHMPVVDGFALLHALATKGGPNRETPVYVVTADPSDQARIRALRLHAVFFLTKPVPLATLVALVDSTLKKSAARAAAGLKPSLRNREEGGSRDAMLPPEAPPISPRDPPPSSTREVPSGSFADGPFRTLGPPRTAISSSRNSSAPSRDSVLPTRESVPMRETPVPEGGYGPRTQPMPLTPSSSRFTPPPPPPLKKGGG